MIKCVHKERTFDVGLAFALLSGIINTGPEPETDHRGAFDHTEEAKIFFSTDKDVESQM